MARKARATDDDTTTTKMCTKCHAHKIASQDRAESEFYKDRSQRDGYATWCKDCERVYNRAYNAGLKAAEVARVRNIDNDTSRDAFETIMSPERVTRGDHKIDATRTPVAKTRTTTRRRARATKTDTRTSSS
jgi:hypothetical protein